jgi:hypothetical protein
MQARKGGARAPRRTSKIRPKPEVAPPAAGRGLRPCIRSKLASSLLKGSMPAQDTLTFPGTATPPCRGGRQTSLLASCAELPDHIDRGYTAAAHTLVAASVQGRAPCASVTTASTLRAPCSIGCLAWPCQPIVSRAAGTEVRSRTRGARAFKGTGAVGKRVKAAATRQRLARREQLGCIDGRGRHIRSMGMHRIILHAIRPALSPQSKAGTMPGPHARFPGPEVKRKDALRRPTDEGRRRGSRIRGELARHAVQQKPEF